MRQLITLAAIGMLAPLGTAVAGTTDCTRGSCTVTPVEAAWSAVARGVPGGTVPHPRNARGAVLQQVDLTLQEPVDGEDTLCDGRQEAIGRYRWRGSSVTFTAVISAGTDCLQGDPVRFRCATRTITGLGRTRECLSTTWRILTWGSYAAGVGGRYEARGPRAFPLVAMARTVR